MYKKLQYQLPIRNPRDCRVIGGNGRPLDLKKFRVLSVTLGTTLLWDEFGVVPNRPLEVLIGANILTNHQCPLLYLKDNQKRLMFGNANCTECERFRTNPEVNASAQQKCVDRNPKRRRNRCKIGAHFVATLPEIDEHKQNKIQLEPDTVHLEPDIVHFKPDTVETNLTCEQQTGKLQKVLADIRVFTRPIPDQMQKRLMEVIKENLDAFSASLIDLGGISVVVHTIKTGEAKPFRQKLQPNPFA